MNYTVQKLAKLSGVSIRTLRYYDEIGLLKPAFIGENKYRYYQEEQLLRLQQILFFKELGFELKQIKGILESSDFDTLKALRVHAQKVEQRMDRLRKLSKTVDKTIKHLEGKQAMKDKEMYYGFDSERQKKYEKDLEAYFSARGKKAMQMFKEHMVQSKENVKNWSKDDWAQSNRRLDAICTALTDLMKQHVSPEDQRVQTMINNHFQWLSNFWTPDKESYKGHAQLILDTELRDAYDKYDPSLPEYLAAAIKVYADTEL